MDIQRAIDVVEIQGLLGAYAAAIDDKDYDLLDGLFLRDARLIYDLAGGVRIDGPYPEVKAWIRKTIDLFPVTEHLLGLPVVRADGDRATARTMLFNPMLLRLPQGDDRLFFIGGIYRDRLDRTGQGWRISERHETGTWDMFAPTEGWELPDFPVR